MQKFILITLVLGLAFFLYLLQTGQISRDDFDISKNKSQFIIKKSINNELNSSVIYSDLYANIRNQEYKLFTFSGNDFNKLLKYEYSVDKYKVPLEAVDAISITWVGNRYVFYILERDNQETGLKTFEIFRAEYATDDTSKLKFIKIKSIEESDILNNFEVKY